ncbi:MAG: glycosyltransferase [bacterium]|nr:glycosyltransferase [bacterium]
MLSIIVSSCEDTLFSNLSNSIENTVGIEYELIPINNKNAKYSLSEAYNLGALKARFGTLLFVHEDVIFHTKNWGRHLVHHIETLPNVGIVGIAGSTYKPFIPSSWHFERNGPLSFHFIQGYKYSSQPNQLRELNASSARPVVCLDGVFLAVKRSTFETVRFDEVVEGFHAYDIDFSLRIAENFQNFFVPDILIEHLSEGKINDQWIINALNVQQRWKMKLPRSIQPTNELDLEYELGAYDFFIRNLLVSSLPMDRKMAYLARVTFEAMMRTISPKFIATLLRSFMTLLRSYLRRA